MSSTCYYSGQYNVHKNDTPDNTIRIKSLLRKHNPLCRFVCPAPHNTDPSLHTGWRWNWWWQWWWWTNGKMMVMWFGYVHININIHTCSCVRAGGVMRWWCTFITQCAVHRVTLCSTYGSRRKILPKQLECLGKANPSFTRAKPPLRRRYCLLYFLLLIALRWLLSYSYKIHNTNIPIRVCARNASNYPLHYPVQWARSSITVLFLL